MKKKICMNANETWMRWDRFAKFKFTLLRATIRNYYLPSNWKCVESFSIKAFLCTRANSILLSLSLSSISHWFGYWLLTARWSSIFGNYKSSTRLHRLFTHSFVHSHEISFLFARAKRVIQVHDVWYIFHVLAAFSGRDLSRILLDSAAFFTIWWAK